MTIAASMENHYAIVTDNNDPEKRGRLKLQCQSLTGAGHELPEWVDPASPPFSSNRDGGGLWLPVVGSAVELTVTTADAMDDTKGERFLQNPAAKWHVGVPTGQRQPMQLPAALITNYPHRRGFVSPAGHIVILDDKSGELIIQNAGGGKITIQKDGTIVLTSPAKLGASATELMILGNAFMALYNAHTHPTGVGPTGAPVVPMTVAQLSQTGNAVT